MYVCVRVRVCEEDVHEKRKRNENEKRKEREIKMKREMRRIKKQEWREKDKNLFIQINTHTDRQTDGQIDRHKSFIDMRYNTEQYSKSNSIESNRIQSNQVDSIWNKITSSQVRSQ